MFRVVGFVSLQTSLPRSLRLGIVLTWRLQFVFVLLQDQVPTAQAKPVSYIFLKSYCLMWMQRFCQCHMQILASESIGRHSRHNANQ